MTKNEPSAKAKSGIFGIGQLRVETTEDLSKRLAQLESKIERQDSHNRNVVIGVLVALVFIVATVAVEVLVSDHQDGQHADTLLNRVHEVDKKQTELNIEIGVLKESFDSLRDRNPYLK